MKNKKFAFNRHWLITDEDAIKEQLEAMALLQQGEIGQSEDKVETDSNKIYFYSEVKRSSILYTVKELKRLERELPAKAMDLGLGSKEPIIELHINSFGGHLFDGFAVMDHIRNSKLDVHTIVNGCAASAATMISIVGKKRFIYKHSYMLIHQLSSGVWGTYEEIVDEKKNCDLLMEMIRNIYKKYTKIPEKTLKEILKRDLWFDSKTCLEYGLVDEVIE